MGDVLFPYCLYLAGLGRKRLSSTNYFRFAAMSRPVVSVYDPENVDTIVATVSLPAVLTAPIRSDVVHYVHTLMAKNARQAYAVSLKAGHQVNYSFVCAYFFT